MRYDITLVLEGIQAHRQERIARLQGQTAQYQDELTASYKEAEAYAATAQEWFEKALDDIKSTSFVFKNQLDSLDGSLYHLRRGAPSDNRVQSRERQIKSNVTLIENLNQQTARCDSPLEVFLKGVQAGGETHVSQHGLTQAGFKDQPVSLFIAARYRANVKEG